MKALRHLLVCTAIALAVVTTRTAAAPLSPSCSIDASAPLSFGAYDVFAATPLDSVAGLTVRCNHHQSASLGLSGLLASGMRSMAGQTSALGYNIYANAVRSLVAGDGSFGASPIYVNVNEHTGAMVYLYGRMPAGQDVPAGAYVATLLATLNF